jgi:Type II secretion system (T2SS), protein G
LAIGKKIFELVLILPVLLLAGCGAASHKLSQDKVKEKIQELGLVELEGKQVEIENISQTAGSQAVAEANFKLALKLSKAEGKDWQIDAVRLGDRNWVEVKAFLAALNEVRARETRENLQKLSDGLRKFKEKTGKYPQAQNIVKLTDILFPAYMSEIIRYDGWNQELIFNSISPDSFELLSLGADGVRGTADDIVLPL